MLASRNGMDGEDSICTQQMMALSYIVKRDTVRWKRQKCSHDGLVLGVADIAGKHTIMDKAPQLCC